MSGEVISRRATFLRRTERRISGGLSMAEVGALELLLRAYDPLELRAYCAGHGFRLERRHTYIAGVKRAYLVHRKAA
jgi:hypothetical protein